MAPHESVDPADDASPVNDAALADEPIKAPGFAAMLRRHPPSWGSPRLRGKHAAFGSIAIGAALFVVASMTTQFAGAQTSHSAPPPAPTASVPDDLSALLPLPSGPTTPAAAPSKPKKQIKTTRAHTKRPAPANAAVISGLAANGIPTVALNAYRVAAARMNHSDPGCGIDWSLLAGIGREESDHGRFAGATLRADGTSVPRIIGIPLNGAGTEVIRDTDNGSLDGDQVFDRAVGPMQFIPSTWAGYGVDADGDGRADPFDINDAALTAARYLCAAGGDLRTHAGQVAAVLAYNHSGQYLAQVLALADAYHRGVPISGIPVGNITGKVDPGAGTNVPPANPAGPTAVDKNTPKKAAHAKPAHKTTRKTHDGTSGTTTTTGGTSTPGPAKPAPSGSPTTPPRSGSGSTAPTSPAPGSGGSTPTGGASSGTSSGPSPTPSPTPTKKCILWTLNKSRCLLYSL